MNCFSIRKQNDPEKLTFLWNFPPFSYPPICLYFCIDGIPYSLFNPLSFNFSTVRSLPHVEKVLCRFQRCDTSIKFKFFKILSALKSALPIEMLEQVPLVRTVPRDLIRRDRS